MNPARKNSKVINLRYPKEALIVNAAGAVGALIIAEKMGTWSAVAAKITIRKRLRVPAESGGDAYSTEADFSPGPLFIPAGGGSITLGSTQLEGCDELVARLDDRETGGTDDRYATLAIVLTFPPGHQS